MEFREVVAVFLRANNGSYLLQLRDDNPSIEFPGHWGLFGGTIENGESPCEAASRELEEEIEIRIVPEEIYEYRQYLRSNYLVHACICDMEISLSKLRNSTGDNPSVFL